jgi:hypothetical protein
MAYWIYDGTPTEYEQKMYDKILNGTKNETAAHVLSRFIGLYKFIDDQKFRSSKDLHDHIFLDKEKREHFFSEEDAADILGKQSGGGNPVNEPFDALFDRWMDTMVMLSPECIRKTLEMAQKVVFFGKTAEEMPGVGPFIGFALDLTVKANGIMAKLLQKYTGLVIPVFGVFIGYLFSTFFILPTMAIHVSRRHLGQAYKVSFTLIPVFGMALEDFADAGDGVLGSFSERRDQMLDSLKGSETPFISNLGHFLDSVIIDPEYVATPEEMQAQAARFQTSAQTFRESEGVQNLLNNANNIAAIASEKAREFQKTAKTKANQTYANVKDQEWRQQQLQKVKDAAQSTKKALVPVATIAQQEVQKVKDAARIAAQPHIDRYNEEYSRATGGKRLSRRKHKKLKWATMKRSRR